MTPKGRGDDMSDDTTFGHGRHERCDECATDAEIQAHMAGRPAPDIWWNMPQKRCGAARVTPGETTDKAATG